MTDKNYSLKPNSGQESAIMGLIKGVGKCVLAGAILAGSLYSAECISTSKNNVRYMGGTMDGTNLPSHLYQEINDSKETRISDELLDYADADKIATEMGFIRAAIADELVRCRFAGVVNEVEPFDPAELKRKEDTIHTALENFFYAKRPKADVFYIPWIDLHKTSGAYSNLFNSVMLTKNSNQYVALAALVHEHNHQYLTDETLTEIASIETMLILSGQPDLMMSVDAPTRDECLYRLSALDRLYAYWTIAEIYLSSEKGGDGFLSNREALEYYVLPALVLREAASHQPEDQTDSDISVILNTTDPDVNVDISNTVSYVSGLLKLSSTYDLSEALMESIMKNLLGNAESQ